jgi:transcriptional regulator with XRE-family HTH domain
LSPERRRKIKTRAKEIMAEEMTLREVRKAVNRTQIQVAKVLGINRDGVSRLEQRADLLLSTIRSYKAIGGELKLVVKLPNQRTVILSGISGIGARGKSDQPKRKKSDLSPAVELRRKGVRSP